MEIFYLVRLFANWITYSIFKIEAESLVAKAINFFIYDVIKISILLLVVIFVVSLFRTFVPPQTIRAILSRKNEYVGNILAAIFGIFTPFCTCSAIPLFLGFIEAGIPLGVTFSFIIASPMINEVACILLLGMFGWKIMLIYVASGLTIAIVSGIIIGWLNVENLVEETAFGKKNNFIKPTKGIQWKNRVEYAKEYTLNTLKKTWLYIVLGIGVGAWIHGFIPTDWLAKYAGANQWYAVPLATLIGIPLYAHAAGIIPLVSVLTEKGVALGTTLSFMMAVTALSLPEFMILRRIMKTKLIVIFAGIVGIGIIFTGYLFNIILK